MATLLLILHVTVCLALIAFVLLQRGKGAEIGASFGAGSSQTVFGATGSKNFMSRLTTSAAVIFMLTSLTLAYFYGQPGSSSIMPQSAVPATSSAPMAAPSTDAMPVVPTAAPTAETAPTPVAVPDEKK